MIANKTKNKKNAITKTTDVISKRKKQTTKTSGDNIKPSVLSNKKEKNTVNLARSLDLNKKPKNV